MKGCTSWTEYLFLKWTINISWGSSMNVRDMKQYMYGIFTTGNNSIKGRPKYIYSLLKRYFYWADAADLLLEEMTKLTGLDAVWTNLSDIEKRQYIHISVFIMMTHLKKLSDMEMRNRISICVINAYRKSLFS